MRWSTGLGIALGGTGGAVAALMGAPQQQARVEAPAPAIQPSLRGAGGGAPPAPAPSAAAPAPSVAPPASVTAAAPAAPALPASREALLKAELSCFQKKDFHECARVAQAHEVGSAGAMNPEQAKRFHKIALTQIVIQCESGSPHACFTLAAKYRAGELAANPAGAEALEKRALELCRFRAAPECPTP